MFVHWQNNPIEINKPSNQQRNKTTKPMLWGEEENCWDSILELVSGDGVTSRGQVLARSTDGASTFLGERAEGVGTGAARGDVLGGLLLGTIF